jgi:hypothetical protein
MMEARGTASSDVVTRALELLICCRVTVVCIRCSYISHLRNTRICIVRISAYLPAPLLQADDVNYSRPMMCQADDVNYYA